MPSEPVVLGGLGTIDLSTYLTAQLGSIVGVFLERHDLNLPIMLRLSQDTGINFDSVTPSINGNILRWSIGNDMIDPWYEIRAYTDRVDMNSQWDAQYNIRWDYTIPSGTYWVYWPGGGLVLCDTNGLIIYVLSRPIAISNPNTPQAQLHNLSYIVDTANNQIILDYTEVDTGEEFTGPYPFLLDPVVTIVNGDFEAGDVGWIKSEGWTIDELGPDYYKSPEWSACSVNMTPAPTIYQGVDLTGATSLSFWYRTQNTFTDGTATLEINGTTIWTLYSQQDTWTLATVPISYTGNQTIQWTNGLESNNFYIDDISLYIPPEPSENIFSIIDQAGFLFAFLIMIPLFLAGQLIIRAISGEDTSQPIMIIILEIVAIIIIIAFGAYLVGMITT